MVRRRFIYLSVPSILDYYRHSGPNSLVQLVCIIRRSFQAVAHGIPKLVGLGVATPIVLCSRFVITRVILVTLLNGHLGSFSTYGEHISTTKWVQLGTM